MFEWDPRKAAANAEKHGISFDEAVTVFLDPAALDGPDVEHSSTERRFRRMGKSVGGRIFMLAYTLRGIGNEETRAAYEAKD